MSFHDKEIDITRNIKTIESLKSKMLFGIANLFKYMVVGVKDEIQESITEALSEIIFLCYLLGRRMGISYNLIDEKLDYKIKIGLDENHELQKYYGDLSELTKYRNERKEYD